MSMNTGTLPRGMAISANSTQSIGYAPSPAPPGSGKMAAGREAACLFPLPSSPVPPRIVHHLAVEPGDHPPGDQHDAVDGPLVDVVHEELALEGHIGRAEDLCRPPGRRRVARPEVEAASQSC